MSAAQLDELPAEDNAPSKESSGGNLVPALIAIILAPALTVGAMYFLIEINKPQASASNQITQGGEPLNMEPTARRSFIIGSLIIIWGPIKSRYINLELRLEGRQGISKKY